MEKLITCASCNEEFIVEYEGNVASLVECPHCGAQSTFSAEEVNEPATASDSSKSSSKLDGLDPFELVYRGMETTVGTNTNWEPPSPEEFNRSLEDRYEILELLGRGGMGAVYKAKQKKLDRFVAIKILPVELYDNDQALARFEREAKALAGLEHPNIINIHDFGQTEDNYLYFVMEYIQGGDLEQLRNSGQITVNQALEVIGKVCSALSYAHKKGVVHRDIKPGNILISDEGTVKVADFGLVKRQGERHNTISNLTMTGQGLGTPDYMAPEQKEGKDVDHRADIYAVGVMLYDLLTGSPPRGAWSLPSQKVQLDVRLDEVILKSLQETPELRYQSVNSIENDLKEIQSSTGGSPIPPGAAVKPLPSSQGGSAPSSADPSIHNSVLNSQTSAVKTKQVTHTQAHTDAYGHFVEASKSSNRTLLIMSTISILVIAAVAIYVGFYKKTGDTYNTINNTNIEHIQNNYFNNLVINGNVNKSDLDLIQDIKPYGTLFVGMTKNPISAEEAIALAQRTGAQVLDIDTEQVNAPDDLATWLGHYHYKKEPVWVAQNNKISEYEFASSEVLPAKQTDKHALLAWQGPEEEMLKVQHEKIPESKLDFVKEVTETDLADAETSTENEDEATDEAIDPKRFIGTWYTSANAKDGVWENSFSEDNNGICKNLNTNVTFRCKWFIEDGEITMRRTDGKIISHTFTLTHDPNVIEVFVHHSKTKETWSRTKPKQLTIQLDTPDRPAKLPQISENSDPNDGDDGVIEPLSANTSLTDKKGRKIAVTLLSATDTTVTGILDRNFKQFTLKLNLLDKESQEYVKKWHQQQNAR